MHGGILISVLFLTILSCLRAQSVVDLSGDDWTLSNLASLNISVPAKVPSQAHLDLYAAQVIGDPYYGLNDFNLRWVAWSNWTYTSAPISGLSKNASSTWLLFQGLDTFTSIEFCNQHIAATNNQFRQYYFDVSTIVHNCPSDPVLSINFGSAPNIADSIATQPGQETWPTGVNQIFEFTNRWFVRKEQSDFGWDWGPAFAPAGPWLPMYTIQLGASEVFVRNALVDVYKQGQMNNIPPDQSQPWVVNASLDYIGTLPAGASLSYRLFDPSNPKDNGTLSSGTLQDITDSNSVVQGSVTLPKDSVELWWPTGMGAQKLYNMTISILDEKQNCITSTDRRIGFRTIVLNEGVITSEQLAQGIAPGNNWHFEINGQPFFAKGSNFIPPDAFWPRVTPEKMRRLFSDVVTGNQNMLRVWASGAYSPDFIYDIADELGILLWSEFEFGDSLYPVAEEFLENVFEEVNYQVRRVNHHPSLAFWAGGNELENLELYLVNSSAPADYLRYKDEYELLFLTTIFPAVFRNTKSISYAPSSTSNGYISLNFTDAPYFEERYETLVPGSVYGETDYYNYSSAGSFDSEYYPVGRFSNEFGFHSMPSLQTWQQAVSPRDLTFNSSVIVGRNRHYPPGNLDVTNFTNSLRGMGEMTVAAQRWYPVPNKADSVANFSAWCHTTQIFQADYYASQIQFYRRGSGMRQRTLGSLYWQLEDIWQDPTWAGIEYDGRWKVLHYAAQDIYKNVIISPFYNSSTHALDMYVTSDLWSTANGTASGTWYDWKGNVLPGAKAFNSTSFTVGGLNTTRVFGGDEPTLLGGADPENAVLRLEVTATGTMPNNATQQTFKHTNWYHAAPLSAAKLADPGLTLAHDATAQTFTVEATKGISAWTWLDYPSDVLVTFDANGFWLAKGEKRVLGYEVRTDGTEGKWVGGVTVESLWDNTLT